MDGIPTYGSNPANHLKTRLLSEVSNASREALFPRDTLRRSSTWHQALPVARRRALDLAPGQMAHNRRTIRTNKRVPHQTQDEPTRTARFHVRATGRQAALIRAGASRRGVKLTDYIVNSLCAQAEMDIADQNHFVLPPDKWDEFVKALDAPPSVPPGLARLFSRAPLAESR